MWPIVTDLEAWSVCLSVTVVNPANTAELIEMSFGLRTRVGAGNHVLDVVKLNSNSTSINGRRCPWSVVTQLVIILKETAEITRIFRLF